MFLLAFNLINTRFRGATNYFVLASSLVFYAFTSSWLLIVILVSMIANYGLVAWLCAAQSSRKAAVIAGVVFNLGYLFAFKYACFVGLSTLPWWPGDVGACGEALPLGISFFTFQQLAYLIDLYRRTAPNQRPTLAGFGAFVTFFPHLIAGPITRHNELLQPMEQNEYRLSARAIELGLAVFMVGFVKKVLLADPLAQIANPIFEASKLGPLDAATAALGVVAFSGQIYFDFSGYSDMAVGIALMVGINLPWNFARPYSATSIIEFWRRWHITLSSWLRDYLYIPLGGSRRGSARRYLNLFVTMLLGGLWHGAALTFVAWGALHGTFLTVNHLVRDLSINLHLPRLAKIILVNLAVMFAWIFFRAEGFQSAWNMLASIANVDGKLVSRSHFQHFVDYIPFLDRIIDLSSMSAARMLLTFGGVIGGAYYLACAIDTQSIAETYEKWIVADQWGRRFLVMVPAALMVAAGIYVQGGGAVSFIYFNF